MDKKIPKTTPKLKIEFDEFQKEVVKDFSNYDINLVLGRQGTGKTLLATGLALTSLRKKEFKNIVITRPIVKNDLGFLPGDIDSKMEPWVYPLIHNFNICQDKDVTEKMLKEGTIEILPLTFFKGCTFTDSVVIVDEIQDTDLETLKIIISRLGVNSKMILCGSKEQVDKSMTKTSCIKDLEKLISFEEKIIGYNTLTVNHRNPIVFKILDILDTK